MGEFEVAVGVVVDVGQSAGGMDGLWVEEQYVKLHVDVLQEFDVEEVVEVLFAQEFDADESEELGTVSAMAAEAQNVGIDAGFEVHAINVWELIVADFGVV